MCVWGGGGVDGSYLIPILLVLVRVFGTLSGLENVTPLTQNIVLISTYTTLDYNALKTKVSPAMAYHH